MAALVGCAGAPPPTLTPRSEAPPLPPPSTAPATPSAAPTSAVAVEIRGDALSVNGEVVPADLASLQAALERHRQGAIAAEVLLVDPKPLMLGQLLRAAVAAKLETLALTSDGVRATAALRPSEAATHEVRAGTDGRHHVRAIGQTAEGDHVAAWRPGNPAEEAAARETLRRACSATPCLLRGFSTLEQPPQPLLAFLASWQRVAENAPELELTLVPLVKLGATKVSGRLPPPVIQGVVRENFELFRKCYERGLERNGDLTGRVTVRFVIGRDGKVASVADGGSDIADTQVRDCVLAAFQGLQFPEPEGGIVTVVYPILFAPG
jgi:hypothetical protein